ncbi:hypothetical protein OBBRIDRAFT_637923 [Obba rivulosa]|uniref:Uncharacterized protein n=1 Tax=Obba rivulosa TaxID=1052685 RepID=A0A8E2AVB5_9APHY|nr:hypothetical protein OBBRIDRAFT_637923 [Obba rivulosa]
MANPYGTPVFPRVPNSTPASHKRIPRAPIINPYDKFTQPEFDAWINDITGALKRALGREELPEVPGRTPGVSGRSVEAEYEHDDEDAVEDSFAEVKARRTAKGKQRGTEEGTEAQPVIILSDSEEEAGPEDEEWGEGWSGLANTDHHENGDEADEYTGSEASDEQEEGSSDAPAEVIELLSDSDESEEQVVGGDVTPLHATGETSDEEVDALEDNSPDPEHVYSVAAVVVKLPQMNDIEVQDIEQNEETEGFPPVKTSTSSVDLPDPWDGPRTYAEDFYSGGDIPESSVREANAHILPTEVNSAKDNISIETRIREDIKGATTVLMPPGDNTEDGEELPEEEHDEEEEPDEDEALEFADDEPEEIIDLTEEEHLEPVHARAAAENELDNANRLVTNEMYGMKEQDFSLGDIDQRPIEVPDPWNGPRTFAEDFYAGGELRDIHRLKGQLSPSRLTPDERPSFEFNGDRPSGSVDDCIAAPLPEFAESSPRMSAERTAMQLNDDSDILKGLYADLDNTDLMQADLMNTDMLPQELWDEAVMSSQEGIGAMPTEHAPLTPPRPSLRTHVDWNWPPAFSGRFATGPGHLGMDGGHAEAVHEVFEISDDDEEDEESAEPVGDIHADELVKVDQEEVGTEVNGGPDEETSGVAVRTQIVPYPGESVDTAVVDGGPFACISLKLL